MFVTLLIVSIRIEQKRNWKGTRRGRKEKEGRDRKEERNMKERERNGMKEKKEWKK